MFTLKRLSLLAAFCISHSLMPMEGAEKFASVPYDGRWKAIEKPEDATLFRNLLISVKTEGAWDPSLSGVGLAICGIVVATVRGDDQEGNSLLCVDGDRVPQIAYSCRLTPELLKYAGLSLRFLQRSEMVKLLPATMIRKGDHGQNTNPMLWIPGLAWNKMPGYILRYGNELQTSLSDYARELEGLPNEQEDKIDEKQKGDKKSLGGILVDHIW
jgi:hypothetical protein